MADHSEKNTSTGSKIIDVVSNADFSNLKPNAQQAVLNSIKDESQREGGTMGKILGTKKENIGMHIALILNVIILTFCGIDIICAIVQGRSAFTELVRNCIPIITLTLGYLFGKTNI